MCYIKCMKKLKTKWFNKWAKKNKLSFSNLIETVAFNEKNLEKALENGVLYSLEETKRENL